MKTERRPRLSSFKSELSRNFNIRPLKPIAFKLSTIRPTKSRILRMIERITRGILGNPSRKFGRPQRKTTITNLEAVTMPTPWCSDVIQL